MCKKSISGDLTKSTQSKVVAVFSGYCLIRWIVVDWIRNNSDLKFRTKNKERGKKGEKWKNKDMERDHFNTNGNELGLQLV